MQNLFLAIAIATTMTATAYAGVKRVEGDSPKVVSEGVVEADGVVTFQTDGKTLSSIPAEVEFRNIPESRVSGFRHALEKKFGGRYYSERRGNGSVAFVRAPD